MKKTVLLIPFFLLTMLIASCTSSKQQVINILNETSEKIEKAETLDEIYKISQESDQKLEKIGDYEKYKDDPEVKKAIKELAMTATKKAIELAGKSSANILNSAIDMANNALGEESDSTNDNEEE